MLKRLLLAILLLAGLGTAGAAQQAADGKALAAMSPEQLMKVPAKKLFGAMKKPVRSLGARSIGFYAKGCLAGGEALPINGPAWQVMRLSRNRNWGHPVLIRLLERLATEARANDNWPGLLVGDIAMPRGGPMPSGHASHQVGLDADIWLTPMPNRTLTAREREDMAARLVVKDRKRIDPAVWTVAHARLIARAASYPESPASSFIRRSRPNFASGPRATGPGSRKCVPTSGTTITSTSASIARKGRWAARTSRPQCPRTAPAAATNWPIGWATSHGRRNRRTRSPPNRPNRRRP